MWTILESAKLQREVKTLPMAIQKNYAVWKNIVRLQGPQGLRDIKGFHDEALAGPLKGSRSSRLNRQWRVIYSVTAETVLVTVKAITPHVYR